MMRTVAFTAFAFLVMGESAFAACPPINPAAFPDAVAENGQRIVCIQNELADSTTQRSYEFQLKSIEQSLQNLQLQRRFDALPKPPPAVVTVPVYSPPALP